MSRHPKRAHLEALQEAFCATFSLSDLKQMVYFKLGQGLDEIVQDQHNLRDQVFELIRWAERNGQLDELISSACDANVMFRACLKAGRHPRPPVLSPPAREHPFPEVWRFDLEMVPPCVEQIAEQAPLCGITVPCNVDAFRENFCQRLQHLLGRKNIDIIADRFTLTQIDTVDTVQLFAAQIERLKDKLQKRHLLCAIKLESPDPLLVGQQVAELWGALRIAFQGSYNHRLIVVFFTCVDFAQLDGMVSLEPPRFHPWHVRVWVQDVAAALEWEDPFLEQWRNRIIHNCKSGADLHIELVYSYLSRSLKLLSRRPQPSPEVFLDELY